VKILRLLIAVSLVLLVQTQVLDRYPWVQLLDLFLLLNVYFALNFDQLTCMGISLPSGLLQDAFSKGIIGMNAFSKTVVVFLISGLSSRLMLKHPLVIMMLVFFATLLDIFLIRGLHMLFGLNISAFNPKMIFVAASLNSVVGLISFQIADRIRMKKQYA
jgi:rod shape-determining protein MreD